MGPTRVWTRHGNAPGLAMSRSMGDRVAAECGVVSEPELVERDLTSEDKCIIIASDGVWEQIGNQEAGEMVVPFWNARDVEGACDRIVGEAVKRWGRDGRVDDITCVVVFISTETDATTLELLRPLHKYR